VDRSNPAYRDLPQKKRGTPDAPPGAALNQDNHISEFVDNAADVDVADVGGAAEGEPRSLSGLLERFAELVAEEDD
jgi:hypothetical protein